MARVAQGDERYDGDQLVVELQQRELVERVLKGIGFVSALRDTDALLGLALLDLTDTAQTTEQLINRGQVHGIDWRAIAAKVEAEGRQTSDKQLPALDVLLRGLRIKFEKDFGFPAPAIGKNRALEKITTGGGRPVSGGEPHVGADAEVATLPKGFKPWTRERPGDAKPVHVGLLDTKIDNHPFLAGAYLASPSSIIPPDGIDPDAEEQREGGRPRSFRGHGTFVAGLILKRAPNAILHIRHVPFDSEGTADIWTVAKELVAFAGSGISVINCALCCWPTDDAAPLVLERAIGRLGAGITVVAAAGNIANIEESVKRVFPAALDGVLAVGAIGDDKGLAPFSPNAPWVDVVAPGVNIASTYLSGQVTGVEYENGRPKEIQVGPFANGYALWSGTSAAAAAVTGQLAAAAEPVGMDVEAAIELASVPDSGIQPF
jgi:membrane-anchored mycosin MYCP